jgi:hypothetical protein
VTDGPEPGVLDALQRRTLMKVLDQLPDRLEDLDITITRTDATSPERLGTSGHKVRSVPYNQAASDIRVNVERALRKYAVQVSIVTGVRPPATPAAKVAYLVEHLPRIVNDSPAIRGIYTDLVTHGADAIRRVIDRPIERQYIGPCPACQANLMAPKDGPDRVVCRSCRAVASVSERRAALLEKASTMVGSAELIARILPWFGGEPIKANTVRQWASRGRVETVKMNGETMYRIGDVIAVQAAGSSYAAAA